MRLIFVDLHQQWYLQYKEDMQTIRRLRDGMVTTRQERLDSVRLSNRDEISAVAALVQTSKLHATSSFSRLFVFCAFSEPD